MFFFKKVLGSFGRERNRIFCLASDGGRWVTKVILVLIAIPGEVRGKDKSVVP